MAVRIRFVLGCMLMLWLTACAISTDQLPLIGSMMASPTVTATLIPLPDPNANLSTPVATTCSLVGTLKLGAVISMTGSAQSYGESIRRGMDLALVEINNRSFVSLQSDLEIVYEDDKSDRTLAGPAFERLITEEQVLGILGPTLSSAAFEADPIAQDASVPVLATSNTAAGISEMGSYIFRVALPEESVIPNTLNTVVDNLDIETVAIVYDKDDAFTKSAYEVMERAATQQGLEIVAIEAFAHETRNFDDVIESLEDAEPDLIMVSALIDEGSKFLQQLREADIDTPMMGGNGFNSPNLTIFAEGAEEGVVTGAAWAMENVSAENSNFVAAYHAAYDEDPDQFAAQAYTGVYLFATALKTSCSTEHSNIRNSLANLRLIPTPLGKFSFTNDRNPLHPPVVLIFKDGKQVLYQ